MFTYLCDTSFEVIVDPGLEVFKNVSLILVKETILINDSKLANHSALQSPDTKGSAPVGLLRTLAT